MEMEGYGEIVGVKTGTLFASRRELSECGVHRPAKGGVSVGECGAHSLIINNRRRRTETISDNQIFLFGNTTTRLRKRKDFCILAKNVEKKAPVRVVYPPFTVQNMTNHYLYEGIFDVEKVISGYGNGKTVFCLTKIKPGYAACSHSPPTILHDSNSMALAVPDSKLDLSFLSEGVAKTEPEDVCIVNDDLDDGGEVSNCKCLIMNMTVREALVAIEKSHMCIMHPSVMQTTNLETSRFFSSQGSSSSSHQKLNTVNDDEPCDLSEEDDRPFKGFEPFKIVRTKRNIKMYTEFLTRQRQPLSLRFVPDDGPYFQWYQQRPRNVRSDRRLPV